MKKSIIILFLLLGLNNLYAQTLEPKLYANIPTGLNVALIGYGHTQGAIPENTSLGLENPNLNIESTFLAYARTFGLFGRNTKFDIIIPYSTLDGTAEEFGKDVSRHVRGIGDMKARISFNIFGAPALSFSEFANYKPDTVMGVSLQVSIPTGQYDSSKLVNIGTNRWALKPGIGIAKTINDFTIELSADAEFYSKNDAFYGGISRVQDTIYSAQVHVLYAFKNSMWLSVGTTYYKGGAYSNNGIPTDTELSNTRVGATMFIPINRLNSIRLYANSGINTRYGTDFDALGISWQYIWMDR
ncbi:QbdB [hydrothermal vent metagenome]|uniref:QbdB n=1 Tax=hydrothermal vent metagenome TaxID=652676 RepID=A0A1W1EF03_9ZZZZ